MYGYYCKEFQVFKALCKGCRACVKVCPNFAIEFNTIGKGIKALLFIITTV
ncbi:hypothetical protein DXT63_12500 [Thermoanaerobacteraceae bacterium SP2]|nr:hypothetical protein DXT63_12500 [Thermoanaerobacteraceae bacterium SP2]